jgi:signal transduction histidine kinase
MSIRLRFTLLYTGILAVTLLVFGLAVYTVQAQANLNRSKTLLVSSARRIAAMRTLEATGPRRQPRPPANPNQTDSSNPRQFVPGASTDDGPPPDLLREPFREQEVYLQVRDKEGTILFRSANLNDEELPLSDAGRRAAEADQPWTETVRILGGRVLVYNEPARVVNDQLEIVQVARSLSDIDHTQSALLLNLLIASSVVLLAAFGIGWFFSGVVLRPITRITQTAQAIGAEQDFGKRVAYRGPRDEVGQLVATFNTMLAQLQSAYSRVEQALQIRRRFVADVSHELRTPLTTIRGNIELLRRVPPIAAEDQSTVINDIVHETERLIRLVNDLLMLEHSDGVQRLRAEAVPVKPLVEAVCGQASRLTPDRAVTCAQVEDVAIIGDPDAFRQILLILLDNAITHTAGDVRVVATAAEDMVEIGIHDQGPGIAPEAIEAIFERFYRGRDARTKPGTGLGLSIARALAEAQEGAIAVESRPGEGSVFRVRLPRAGG